jgi:hypothetical protein
MNDDLNPVESEPVTQEPESNGEAPPDLLWIREGADFVITTIYVYQDSKTKRLKFVIREPLPTLLEQGLIEYPVETRWTVPTRGQLDSYRTSSARYNNEARAVLMQRVVIEELLIKNHLQEIVLGLEGHQSSVVIQRDGKGRLSRESQTVIDQLHPSVMDVTLAKFVDDAALLI